MARLKGWKKAPRLGNLAVVVVALASGTAARGQYNTYAEVTACNGVCTDLSVDPANCGACGAACSTSHLTGVACSAGSCSSGACAAGWGDCNGNKQTDGCETAVTGDVNNCGGCGVVCSANWVMTRACVGGSCSAGTCYAGRGDCNGNMQTDGCETSLLNNSLNCGACGRQCSSSEACLNGACVWAAPPECPAGKILCCGEYCASRCFPCDL